MAVSSSYLLSSILVGMIMYAFLHDSCYCFKPKSLVQNESDINQLYQFNYWSPGGATWYGNPQGAGSDGGSCGYLNTVDKPPLSGMVSAAGSSLYQSGEGCGVCYQVRCVENHLCSGEAVTVTITDVCPGCPSDKPHFDLSGTAFGAMAKPGYANRLRNDGILAVQYKRVNCNYGGEAVVIRVDPGANSYYFAMSIEYANGEGIKRVMLKDWRGGEWMNMERSWGAVWKLNAGRYLQPPLSLLLVEANSGAILPLYEVIPWGWMAGQNYRSSTNFRI